MKRWTSILLAGVVFLVCVLCACHKREDATQAAATTTAAPSGPAAGSAAPSAVATASAAPSAVASADRQKSALEEAEEFGMIGLLNASDSDASSAPRREERGQPRAPDVNMWGDPNLLGSSSVEMLGTGGGNGNGVGLGNTGGNTGTIGHGSGGPGRGSRLGDAPRGQTPRVRQGAMTVSGRLPPEVVQRIVRQNFGRFRLCYQDGLRNDPKLSGTVATRFVVDAQGSVSSAGRNDSTTLTDASVVACITRAFLGLSFPQPEGGGIVTVVYPLILEPGDQP